MKRNIVAILAVAALATISAAWAQGPADVKTVVAGSNAFAGKIYTVLAKEPGNLFLSPYSISSALTMTFAGARGRTAEQMARVLGVALPPDRLFPAAAALMAGLNAKDKPYQMHVANALWGQARYPFAPAFLETVRAHFAGGFREVDFVDDAGRESARRTINDWTADRTGQKIKDLIGPRILTALTRLVLTNAIYFKGSWAMQFRAADTRPMPFSVSAAQKIDVPMMRQKGTFGYAETAALQVLELPYAGGDLAMVVLLPKEMAGLGKIEAALPGELDRWLAALSKEEVSVWLPKFRLEQQFLLNEPLTALGMEDAFSEAGADFSGMRADGGKDLYISKVIHKAFVDVNEEGTEAAAATAVIMGTKSIPLTNDFRADHPFLFLIRDVRSGAVLFLGRLAEPK